MTNPNRALKRNYHTHTYRCKHASGDCVDYAAHAERLGMEVLGFSDHTPLPDNRWHESRMALDELQDYERAVRDARARYPNLTILLGLECEHTAGYHAFLEDELLGKRGYDYLIGAAHYIRIDDHWQGAMNHARAPGNLRSYVDQIIATIDCGLFAFVAHPDLFGACNHDWNSDCAQASRDICQAAHQADVPLELNGYGLRKPWINTCAGRRPKYPWTEFWKIAAEEQVSTVMNSDAHQPQDVGHGKAELSALRDRLGLSSVDVLERLNRCQ